jgi:hypothetical protein
MTDESMASSQIGFFFFTWLGSGVTASRSFMQCGRIFTGVFPEDNYVCIYWLQSSISSEEEWGISLVSSMVKETEEMQVC